MLDFKYFLFIDMHYYGRSSGDLKWLCVSPLVGKSRLDTKGRFIHPPEILVGLSLLGNNNC